MRASTTLDMQDGRREARAVLLAQGLIGLVVAGGCWAAAGRLAGMSALYGAGIGVAATTLMALAMLRGGSGMTATRAAIGLITGWLVKVAFTIAVLALALRSPGIEALPLIGAYAATFLGYWVGAARASARSSEQQFGVAD
ncbi:MAG TPA: ATP synthase subunit I [Steroidobacteraceae bacterium]|nr:ATP synthase subunit I [Steroidobacteraceae bacterium]